MRDLTSNTGIAPRMAMLALCGGMLLPLASRAAEDSAPVQAGWKVEEIRYSYTGFTTAYSCDAAEDKLKAILLALGAHEQTRVSAQGCEFNRPSRNFFITITTAVPVPAADKAQPTAADKSRAELLKRLNVASKQLDETFPAHWRTVALTDDRKLNIEAGDCELMEGVRDHVLPKLSAKIVTDRVECIPRQVSLRKPELTVSALVALPSADKARK